MKTYILFAMDMYYPQGGMDDVVAVFSRDSDEGALAHTVRLMAGTRKDYWQLVEVCSNTLRKVAET